MIVGLLEQLQNPLRLIIRLLIDCAHLESRKKAVTLYRINQNHFDLIEAKTTEMRIKQIVTYSFKVSTKSIRKSTLQRDDVSWFLFSYTPKISPSSWSDFLPGQLGEGHVLESGTTYMILFAAVNDAIYYIQGGNPNRRIARFTTELFGVYVLCALTDIEGIHVQRVEHRPIEGIVLVNDKAYNEQQSMLSIKRIGYVPMKIIASAGRIFIDSFMPLDSLESNKSLTLVASNGFRITSELNFDELSNFVKICDKLYQTADFATVSDLIPLTDGNLINELNSAVIRKIFENQGRLQRYDIVVLHPSHPIRYVSADQYTIVFDRDVDKETAGSRDTVLQVAVQVINRNVEDPTSKVEFFRTFGKIQIHARWAEGRYEKAPLGAMLQTSQLWGHVRSNTSRMYLKLAGRWFSHTMDFLAELDKTLIRLLSQAPISEKNLLASWIDGEDEQIYNLKQQQRLPNSICLDTITPEGVELCDILHFAKSETYFIHVKRGFNANMRDLCYQAINAHSYIQSEITKDHSEGLFRIWAKAPFMFNEISYHDWLNRLSLNPWKFVIAIGVKTDMSVDNFIHNSRSSVAKLSLIDAISTFLDSKCGIGVAWIKIVDSNHQSPNNTTPLH